MELLRRYGDDTVAVGGPLLPVCSRSGDRSYRL